jgi:hypothetical protein
MTTELDYLLGYGDELLSACRDQVATLPVTRYGPVNASGRLAQELRREAFEVPGGFRLQVYAPGYALTLIFGRRPGTFPNLTGIKQWIAVKGIVPHPDKHGKAVSTDSLAYLIGRKIQREGNTVWQENQGQPSPLFKEILGADDVLAALKAHFVPVLIERVFNVLAEAVAE